MEENFVFLTAVSDYEVDLVCQRLKGAGIRYLVRDSTANAWQRQYGGVGLMGKEILVRASELIRAKELLGIKDKEQSFYHRRKENFIWKIIGGIAVVFAGISIISNFLFTPKLFQKFAKLFPIIFSKKLFIILFLISIVLAGGVFAWQYFGEPKDETADWQTYRNKEYGVEFEYPPSWILDEKNAFSVNLPDQTRNFIQINISNGVKGPEDESMNRCQPGIASMVYQVGKLRENQQTFEEFVNFQIENPERGTPLAVKPKLILATIGGHDALKIEEIVDNCKTEFYYVEQSSDRYMTISFIVDKNDDKLVINQILSTLRFLEDETASWNTYKNEEYGFEIKYPPNFFTEDETNGIKFIEEQWKGQKVHFPFIGIEFIKTPLTPQQWVAEKGTEVSLVEEPPPGFQSSKYQYFGAKDKITKTIGTLQVFQFYSAAVSSGTNHTLIQQEDNTLIDIYKHSSGMGEVSKDIYNKMLSTFRFLE